jgi:adenylate cyclase
MTPEQLVSMINTYLSLMTRTIMDNNGTVDKYIGDAIMAIYGAPVFTEDHPARAGRTALKMMEDLASVKDKWTEKGYPEIKIGIGINTGLMVVGNMGSVDRFDYTVMGDSVNLASRLEGLTKAYGAGIIVSEFTADKLEGFILKDIDLVRVKGKDKPIRIYELLSEGPLNNDVALELEQYGEALEFYRKMQWDKAFNAFNRLKENHSADLYGIYGKRCESFKENPPEGDWDGVFTFTTK